MIRHTPSAYARTLIFLLALPGIAMVASSRGQADLPKPEETTRLRWEGVVDYLEGRVLIDESAAEIGDSVHAGSTVATDSESLCDIVFDEQNILHIEEDTTVRIAADVGILDFRVTSGVLAAVFNRLDRLTDTEVNVRTPTTVLGVRGTAFFVKIESEDSTYVCVCNGTVRLQDADGANELAVRSPLHTAYRFAERGGAISVESAELLYHDTPGMNRIAERIGVRIPWGEYQ